MAKMIRFTREITTYSSLVYFPAVPHRENPLVLLQKAVKLTVEVVRTRLVIVDVPKDRRKRLGPTDGTS